MEAFERVPKRIINENDNFVKKEIIDKVKEELSSKYIFDRKLVGSASKNLVVTDADGKFDLDYHLILSSNSNKYNNSATKIKNDVHHTFQKIWGNNAQNSTTAITIFVHDKKDNYDLSVDIVILKKNEHNDNLIIKRNLNKNSDDTNAYNWNEIPTRYDWAYEKFDSLNDDEKRELAELVVEYKIEERKKTSNTPLSGFELFLRAVYNYGK